MYVKENYGRMNVKIFIPRSYSPDPRQLEYDVNILTSTREFNLFLRKRFLRAFN